MSHSTETDGFDRLRFLLGEPPSAAVWAALMALLEAPPEGEEGVALEYAGEHVKGWPVELCEAPGEWLRGVMEGEGAAPGALALCRRWELNAARIGIGGEVLERLVGYVEGLWEAGGPCRVEELALSADGASRDGVVALLEALPGLRRLRLDLDPVEGALVGGIEGALGALGRLEALALSRVALRAAPLVGARWWSTLRELELRHAKVMDGDGDRDGDGDGGGDGDGEELRRLLRCGRAGLERLVLQGERLGVGRPKAIGGGWGLEALRELELSGVTLGEAGLQALLRTPEVVGLRALRLNGNQLGNRGVRALYRVPEGFAPEVLELGAVGVGQRGVQDLARARWLACLRTLRLSSNALRDEGVRALARSPALEGLETLWLDWTEIGAEGTRALLEATWGGGLRCLDLTGNEGMDLGAFLAGADRAFPSLRVLHLTQCRLGDIEVAQLVNSPLIERLEELHLSHNRIGNAGALRLLDGAPPALRLPRAWINRTTRALSDALRAREHRAPP